MHDLAKWLSAPCSEPLKELAFFAAGALILKVNHHDPRGAISSCHIKETRWSFGVARQVPSKGRHHVTRPCSTTESCSEGTEHMSRSSVGQHPWLLAHSRSLAGPLGVGPFCRRVKFARRAPLCRARIWSEPPIGLGLQCQRHLRRQIGYGAQPRFGLRRAPLIISTRKA